MWPKQAHAQSQYWAVKSDQWHACYSFRLYARTAEEMDEERKASLEKMVATELLKLTMETDEERKQGWRRW